MLKSPSKRNEEQRLRQQQYREKLKAQRKPGRDDIARVALHWIIVQSEEKGQGSGLAKLENKVVARLAEQGFDLNASYEAFEDLIDKYTGQRWDFRRKPHLRTQSNNH